MRLDTILVRAGGALDPATGALAPPIHLSTTFEHTPDGQSPHGHLYIRESNPTQTRLEEALTAAEAGGAALAFASGMAAGAAYMQHLPAGSHVLMHKDIYAKFRAMAKEFLPRWGGAATEVDMTDLEQVRQALRSETRVVWMETPSNPLMDVIDIAALAAVAHEAGAELLVDGTFATPALQRPLHLGADVVLHSMTKYLGGHSDALGGVLVFRARDARVEAIHHIRTTLGGVLSPFNAWLVLRGLRSLSCRMDRHSANALAVAQRLETHPGIERVHYPGLPSHPGHETAKRQMRGFGGMLSFQVKGGREETLRFASRVRLFLNATSLGGVESTLEHRASVEGPHSTTPENLVRVSVGLEAPEDLVEDLMQALG